MSISGLLVLTHILMLIKNTLFERTFNISWMTPYLLYPERMKSNIQNDITSRKKGDKTTFPIPYKLVYVSQTKVSSKSRLDKFNIILVILLCVCWHKTSFSVCKFNNHKEVDAVKKGVAIHILTFLSPFDHIIWSDF